MLRLYAINQDDGEAEGRHLLSFVYFHGEAEWLTNYDLVEIADEDDIGDGITPVTIVHGDKEVLGLAFIWRGTNPGIRRGLVCIASDGPSVAYATKSYTNKENFL